MELIKILFQSLTGSIHTKRKKAEILPQYQSFNPSQVQFTQGTKEPSFSANTRFNPSQVQFTLIYECTEWIEVKLFQSLTGSIHTKKNWPSNLGE